MNFTSKKILFISPSFFDYENAITSRLQRRGAKVDFFDERPSNSWLTKGIIRVYKRLYQSRINTYYQKILETTKKENYDYFLLLKGESIPYWFIQKLKTLHPDILTVFYIYDTVEEYPRFLELIPFFDKVITFDPQDAIKYNIPFRPLFYLDDYKKTQSNTKYLYDLAFIGTAHTDRYAVGENLLQASEKLRLRSFIYYYSPSKMIFLLRRIFDKTLKSFDLSKLSFKKLSHPDVAKIYQECFAVVDINKPFQNGLSLRTFEALIAGKKLITTNSEIVKYSFYNPNNILVITRDTIELPPSFFETEYCVDKDAIEIYRLDAWLDSVFLGFQNDYWQEQLTKFQSVISD